MNHIRRICRTLFGQPRRAGLLLAPAAPAVLWADPPLPPGWNKHSPLPAHVHPLATVGISGRQLTLMAVTVVLLAATLIAISHLGPGRTAAGERTHRLSDDRIRRRADPQGQPQGEQPPPAGRPGRNGFAGRFIQNIAAATSLTTGQHLPAPSATMPRRRTMIAPRRADRQDDSIGSGTRRPSSA